MSDKFFHGSSLLLGNNTIPGVQICDDFKKAIPTVIKACEDFGLNFHQPLIQMLTHDEISEIASYGGFPVRYPHWKFGEEYEELQYGYMFGMHRIYEMVINTNPAIIYCLNSNTLLDNITVVAHALGHAHFFKNNIYFSRTSQNMLNELANHGSRIRKYMSIYGKEKVSAFIDHVLRLETLIDHSNAWHDKTIKEIKIKDEKIFHDVERIQIDKERLYMNQFINTEDFINKQKKKIKESEMKEELGFCDKAPTKDIFGFVKENAPLKPWQADIVSMLYDESLYFAPQGATKTINEGFASYVDYNIIARQGYASLGQKTDCSGIFEYAIHKMGVLGGKYSVNPYKLGYTLLMDVEERWNKGRFGEEYEQCMDLKKKENWDLNLGLGKEKVFEVCHYYNDYQLINEFFTEDFCNKNEFFEWEKNPDGTYEIASKDWKLIKEKLLQKYTNRGLPIIKIIDDNHKGKGYILLEHLWEGRIIYQPYVLDVLVSLHYLMKTAIVLTTKNKNKEEIVYFCNSIDTEEISVISKDEYFKKWNTF
jgi:stage V sporulation protein R